MLIVENDSYTAFPLHRCIVTFVIIVPYKYLLTDSCYLAMVWRGAVGIIERA